MRAPEDRYQACALAAQAVQLAEIAWYGSLGMTLFLHDGSVAKVRKSGTAEQIRDARNAYVEALERYQAAFAELGRARNAG